MLLGMASLSNAPRNFWIFVFAGVLELIVGLGMAAFVGMTNSWTLGLLIACGFFVSANVMFVFAFKKLP